MLVGPEDDRKGQPWIQTYTGRRFYPLNPRASDIYLPDIARGLAQTCRYNRQTCYFYTTAQHSVLMARAIQEDHPNNWGAFDLALLHDAVDAYLPDVPTPIKPLLTELKAIELHLEEVIMERFDLPTKAQDPALWALVKSYDNRICLNERAVVVTTNGVSMEDWLHGKGTPDMQPLDLLVEPWGVEKAFDQFLWEVQQAGLE